VQAVILAAGEGTRMRPLTYTRPKVMLPVANRPILEHLMEELAKAGIDEAVLVVGYRDETIRNHFGQEWNGVKIKYATQRKQLGTADALKSASHLLENEFLMLNGDAIVGSHDIREILNAGTEEGYMALAVREVPNPQDFGVIVVESGYVRKILEKPESPPSNLINAGVYFFTKDILRYVEATKPSVRGEYEVTDSITMAIAEGVKFVPVKIKEWLDVGYPWDLLRANEYLLSRLGESRIEGEVEEGAVIKGPVIVGEGTVVRSGSYVIGPTIIGKNCTIGPNCFIRPHTAIADNCHIGAAVEIKNSIIMSGAKIPHLNYVGDSVIGENCNFGAGTKIANLRLDRKEIYVSVKGKKIPTGRKKLGAIVGDNVQTGINASINVGAMIGNNVFIAPNALVDGYVEPNSKVF
jgi:bifunctional UDP-N-acetylglucosamine pyrophosphorylase/glucosamine-1-phosphate N-acetyltransferase